MTDDEREMLRGLAGPRPGTPESPWPDCHYFPWDDPPIGARVRNRDDARHGTGTVRGAAPLSVPRHSACPDCKCLPMLAPLAGWWRVDYDDGASVMEYPPALMPVVSR